ncbi:MAG: HDOD domain-containing protein [Clostridia bacterium]|nr:HDOD domain-containing protein [Clostridia bacterium]
MNVFVARQPIFDRKMQVYAYELLYRTEDGINDPEKDGDIKTGEVIFNSLVCMGLDQMISGRKAFINFTKDTIARDLPRLFSNNDLVVELLEDIVPDDDFIEQCQALKNSGYTLALDDFVSDYPYENMVDMVHIIKVDFALTTPEERLNIIQKYSGQQVQFLAEKVETKEEYEVALSMGFEYFQGYFFSRPVLVSGNDVKVFNATLSLVIKELNQSEPSYDRLEEIIKKDFSITFKLLKLVNSAAFYSRNRITSVKHALTMLGFKEIRKIFSLMLVRDLGKHQPDELIRMSLIRGYMSEILLKKSKYKSRASEAFLLGLFSCIDIILNKTMEDAVVDLPLEVDIIQALLGEKNVFSDILTIVKFYERGNWVDSQLLVEQFDFEFKEVLDAYMTALKWVVEVENSL